MDEKREDDRLTLLHKIKEMKESHNTLFRLYGKAVTEFLHRDLPVAAKISVEMDPQGEVEDNGFTFDLRAAHNGAYANIAYGRIYPHTEISFHQHQGDGMPQYFPTLLGRLKDFYKRSGYTIKELTPSESLPNP